MAEFTQWTIADAARHIAVPIDQDDKYSRGVLGVITGSVKYPGAAVIGVEAALRTGVGMIRYLGPSMVGQLVLQRRPEAVYAAGGVQAWLIGSGMDPEETSETTDAAVIAAMQQSVPIVLDGASVRRHAESAGPVVITPHVRELATLMDGDVEAIAADPARAARDTADRLGVTVLLKGHSTWVAAPDVLFRVGQAPTWLATAGAGDALGGILGALVATHAAEAMTETTQLAELAATAALVHGLAAARASAGGPFTILDLCRAIPATVRDLLSYEPGLWTA